MPWEYVLEIAFAILLVTTLVGLVYGFVSDVVGDRKLFSKAKSVPDPQRHEAHQLGAEEYISGRSDDDLTVTVPVEFAAIALGAEIEVPSPSGALVRVRIPPGTTNGWTIQIPGEGLRREDGTYGSLLVTVKVPSLPVPLTADSRNGPALDKVQAGQMSRFENRAMRKMREVELPELIDCALVWLKNYEVGAKPSHHGLDFGALSEKARSATNEIIAVANSEFVEYRNFDLSPGGIIASKAKRILFLLVGVGFVVGYFILVNKFWGPTTRVLTFSGALVLWIIAGVVMCFLFLFVSVGLPGIREQRAHDIAHGRWLWTIYDKGVLPFLRREINGLLEPEVASAGAKMPSGSSIECARNCLLDNLPTIPTENQLELINYFKMGWLSAAVVAPFIFLVLIGGWKGTFQSGDASAYMVGAVIVSVTEAIFQQREDSFAILKKRWKESWGKPGHRTTPYMPIPSMFALIVTLTTWNMYFAIHDRHVGKPSVDWVQILIFFLSLAMLPAIRFTATQYDDPVPGETEWTDFLRRRIHSLHSKAERLVQDADIQLDNLTRKTAYKLEDAREIFKKIDDHWCAAHAASIEADAWKKLADLRKARRARYIADDLLKEST